VGGEHCSQELFEQLKNCSEHLEEASTALPLHSSFLFYIFNAGNFISRALNLSLKEAAAENGHFLLGQCLSPSFQVENGAESLAALPTIFNALCVQMLKIKIMKIIIIWL
jgi:hypothetical protein